MHHKFLFQPFKNSKTETVLPIFKGILVLSSHILSSLVRVAHCAQGQRFLCSAESQTLKTASLQWGYYRGKRKISVHHRRDNLILFASTSALAVLLCKSKDIPLIKVPFPFIFIQLVKCDQYSQKKKKSFRLLQSQISTRRVSTLICCLVSAYCSSSFSFFFFKKEPFSFGRVQYIQRALQNKAFSSESATNSSLFVWLY